MSAEDDELSRLQTMQEIEPSPVEDTPREQKESYFAPQADEEQQPPPSRSSSTLGLASHSLPWYLIRIQRYSSYAFTVFTAFHITNTSIIPLVTQSVPASEPYLLLTRPYYQSPLAEPIIVAAPLIAHISSGIALRLYRRRQDLNMYGAEKRSDRRKIPWPKVSGTSQLGYLFLPLVLGHSFINRGMPLKVQGGSSGVNLSFVSHAFAKHPAISWVGFTALIGVGVAHFTWGMARYWSLAPTQVTSTGGDGQLKKKRRWWLINAAAVALAGVWMAGALGVVGRGGAAPGYIGKEYDELYRQIPIVGRWM